MRLFILAIALSPPLPVYPPLLLEPRLTGGHCARRGIDKCHAIALRDEGLVLDENTLAVEEVTTLRAGLVHDRVLPKAPQKKMLYVFPRDAVYALVEAKVKRAGIVEHLWLEGYKGERKDVEALLALPAPKMGHVPVQAMRGRNATFALVSYAPELGAPGVTTAHFDDGASATLAGAWPEVWLHKAFYNLTWLVTQRFGDRFVVLRPYDGKLDTVFDSGALKGFAKWWGDDGKILFTPSRAHWELPWDTLDKDDHFFVYDWNGHAFEVVRRPSKP